VTKGQSFFFAKHEKKGRCFFANSSKTVCTKVSCITKKYITLMHIQRPNVWFLQKTKAKYILKYTKIQSSFNTFSVASCNSLSTTSLVIFIISKASFMAGLASGLYGSSGGERSAAIKNMLVNFEAKNEQRS
jgi:hypothetical protein